MHDKMFENQRALSREDLDKYATEIGLDMAKYKAAMDSGKFKDQVDADQKLGESVGVQGTPSMFLGAERIENPGDFDGLAAHEQGKFWEMHDKMFENAKALDRASLDKYAGEVGLDMGKFKAAMDEGKFKSAVATDQKYADSLGTGGFGTPTFFINGKKIAGAMPFDSFKSIIDEELKKKK